MKPPPASIRFILSLLVGAFWIALAAGCVTHSVIRPDALVRPSALPGYRYEIQLVRDVTTHGNLHALDPAPRQDYADSRWLYVDSLAGELAADHIVLASFRYGSRFFRPQKSLEGRVRFSPDGQLQFALLVPRYGRDSAIERHVAFEFNGTYHLVQTSAPAAEDGTPILRPKPFGQSAAPAAKP